jgi:hypothetical protein
LGLPPTPLAAVTTRMTTARAYEHPEFHERKSRVNSRDLFVVKFEQTAFLRPAKIAP